MTSASRTTFFGAMAAMEQAASEPCVVAGDPAGYFLRRGLMVATFNQLEAFLSDRLVELAVQINLGSLRFHDLPENLQKRAIQNTMAIAHSRVRTWREDVSSLRSYVQPIGAAIASVSGVATLSALTWQWQGSNMNTQGYADALRFLHVRRPFDELLALARRLFFPIGSPLTSVSLEAELEDLIQERHRCAHDATYMVTSLRLRALPTQIVRFAATFDILASIGAYYLKIGHPPFLADREWLTNTRVALRFVRERRSDYAELREGSSRASRVGTSGDALFAAAAGRCHPHEALVRLDRAGTVVDWSVPIVG